MSNLNTTVEAECSLDHDCTAIKLIIHPKEKELGGFSVRRLLPNRECRMVGPWIFFDHMGPAVFPAGSGINVRPHPHIGLATVTYLFDGEILHRDSLGSVQPIRPGDINLMVAGKGIVHSERERPEVTATDHRLDGLQLWLALPESSETMEPAFYHYPGADIPRQDVGGVTMRVIMGQAYGVRSPVITHSDTLYVEAFLEAGQALLLPDARERAVYVASGSLSAHGTRLSTYTMAVFDDQTGVEVTATEDARIAVVGGEPFSRRFIDWNFVSTSKERLAQAREDWKAGRFAKVPGDGDEYIPYPGS